MVRTWNSSHNTSPQLELWGGIECTVNRVGDRYFDQMAWNGHDRRPGDLDLVAGLGIRTLRYPVLWEWVSPVRPNSQDWSAPMGRCTGYASWGCARLSALIHHGSGPSYTSLVDPDFAGGWPTTPLG